MDDAWEALDVDDSDLFSLLRPSTLLPCKRPPTPPPPPPLLQHQQNPNKSNSNSKNHFFSLEACSQFRRPSQNQPKFNNPETLDSQSQQQQSLPHFENEKKNDDPPSTSYSRLIPGPAGTLQAAMKNRQARNNRTNEDQIPTQEYLRRINGEDGNEDDEDFKRNSWLCAMEFLRNEKNSLNSSVLEGDFVLKSNLNSIKTCITTERVPLIVAIVKSCTPNGIGDLIVTLKDPTGTVSANIHRKVLTESEFGKDISVGSVLILQQVAVFSPSHSAHYLNITLRNLVTVISKESGPPTKGHQASTVRFGAWATEECRKTRPEIAEKASDTRLGAAEGITNKLVREYTNQKGSVDVDRQVEESRGARGSSHCNSSYQSAVEIETSLVRQRAANGAAVKTVRGDAKNNGQKIDETDMCPKRGGPFESLNCSSSEFRHDSSAEKSVDHLQHQETRSASGLKKQKQQLISTTLLPEWTDEQLDELSAASWEDVGSSYPS